MDGGRKEVRILSHFPSLERILLTAPLAAPRAPAPRLVQQPAISLPFVLRDGEGIFLSILEQ